MHHEVKQKQLWNKTVPSALVRRLMSLVFSFSKSKFVTPFPFCVCVLKLHTRLPFRCVRLYGNIRMALQNPPSLNTWSLRNSSPDLDYIIKFFFFYFFPAIILELMKSIFKEQFRQRELANWNPSKKVPAPLSTTRLVGRVRKKKKR